MYKNRKMMYEILGTTALVGLLISFVREGRAAAPLQTLEVVKTKEAETKEVKEKAAETKEAEVKKTEMKEMERKKKREGKLSLEISGKSSFNAITGSQSQRGTFDYATGSTTTPPTFNLIRDQKNMFTIDSSSLGFQVLGRTDPGIEFGFFISFTADTNEVRSVRENYLSLKGSFGSILLGDTSGVEDRMAFSGGDTQVGTGGFNGNFERFVLVTTGVKTSIDLGAFGDTGDATKITYITPRLGGFQLGVSYTPDSKHHGESRLNTSGHPDPDMPVPYERNAIAAGLNYVKTFGDLSLSVSWTGLAGQTQQERARANVNQSLEREKTRAWALGFLVEYKGFELGLEYMDNRDSGRLKVDRFAVAPGLGMAPLDYIAKEAQAPKLWDVGIAYNFGQTKASVGYLRSERKTGFANMKATANVFSTGLQHKIGEGFIVYGEYANHKLENPAALYEARLLAQSYAAGSPSSVRGVRSQRANTVIVGTKIQF